MKELYIFWGKRGKSVTRRILQFKSIEISRRHYVESGLTEFNIDWAE